MKRRNDATYVADLDPYKRIFPYIMKRRNDSLVYHQFKIDLTRGVQFIKDMNHQNPGDHQYRVFELFLAAMMRTFAMRPQLNRFLANYEIWQRNELSLNFVVKEDYSDEAPEHSSIVYFQPEMTFPEMASIINRTIENARNGGTDNDSDRAIDFFLHFPKWFIRMFVLLAGWLDWHGIAPKALRDADGLHATAFVANLGSIGLEGSPHHHLYQWGTTSVFVTMGTMRRRRVINENNQRSFIDQMDIGVTLDERIADGFYFIKTIQILQDYLDHPERLLERPELPAPPLTIREVKAKKLAAKKKAKLDLKDLREKEEKSILGLEPTSALPRTDQDPDLSEDIPHRRASSSRLTALYRRKSSHRGSGSRRLRRHSDTLS